MTASDSRGFWHGRPTLVTGGTGFVGSSLALRLSELGARVVCIARGEVPEPELLRECVLAERVVLVRCDVRNRASVDRVIAQHAIDTVLHMAAQAVVRAAADDPAAAFDSNLRGTWTLLEACRHAPTVKQVITASSDRASSAGLALPGSKIAFSPKDFYGLSKACSDVIARAFATSYGMRVGVARSANIFGGGDWNFDRIVPSAIRSVLRGEAPVIRSTGNANLRLLYVEDAVTGYLRLAEELAARSELAGDVFDFSIEQPATVRDLVLHITRLMGSDLPPITLGNAASDAPASAACPSRARSVLGWFPRYSLEAGLQRTIAWYRAHPSPETGSMPPGDAAPKAP